MKTRTAGKITEINRAADLMRTGSVLTQMHKTSGTGWYLVPGGEVAAKVAIALLERPDVQPNHDGLFPGISQLSVLPHAAARRAARLLRRNTRQRTRIRKQQHDK